MKSQKITLSKVRDTNYELLEIILEAKELSTEDKVVKILQKALKVDMKRFSKSGQNMEKSSDFLKRHGY